MGTLYGKTTTQLKKYVIQAYKNKDYYMAKDIYKDYVVSGGKMTYNQIIKRYKKR